MSLRDDDRGLEAVRHDLKNVLGAFEHGCSLLESRFGSGLDDEGRMFLDEMRASVERGYAIVDRLRQIELNAAGSDGSSREVAEP